jgi:hypothetical protein
MYRLKLFRFKLELLKIYVDLQIALSAETRLAEGQWLEQELNLGKLRILPVGTGLWSVPRREGNVWRH